MRHASEAFTDPLLLMLLLWSIQMYLIVIDFDSLAFFFLLTFNSILLEEALSCLVYLCPF